MKVKRGISKEDYIKEYKEKKLEEALKIALDTRKFEIGLYWKRTGYFVLFIGAVFVGYYTILSSDKIEKEQQEWLLLLLAALGYLLSLLWYMANRGSKFWQENWEAHIEELSTHLGVPIFGIIKRREHSIRNLMQEYPFSVSKINQMVSLIITFAWLLILCKEMGLSELLECITFSVCYKTLVGGIVIMLSFLIIICCKGFAVKVSKKGDNLERREWRKGLVCVSGFIVICRDMAITFIKNLFTKSTKSKVEISDYFWKYNMNIDSNESNIEQKD